MNRGSPRRWLSFLLLPVLAGQGRSAETTPRAAAWVLAWIDGRAEFENDSSFHQEFPGSPHREDSERFELAARVFSIQKEIGEKAAEELTALVLRRLQEPAIGEETARRAIFTLAVLRDPQALEALCRLARGSKESWATEKVRSEAVDSLAFFGLRNPQATFSIFGGRLRKVVFPARPDLRATRALLELAGEQPDSGKGSQHLRSRTLRALEFHGGKEVEELVLRLRVPGAFERETVRLLGALRTPEAVRRLGEILKSSEKPFLRETAALELGWTASASAIPPLLAALGDGAPGVRQAAERSLHRLTGKELPAFGPIETDPDPKAAEARWREVLGKDLEKFDTKRADVQSQEPGVYRIGPT